MSAPVLDAESGSAAGNGNLVWNHPGISPDGALVKVASSSSFDQISGVTYGTVPMVETTDSPLQQQLGDEDGAVHSFFLGSGVPAGTQEVVVTVTGGASKRAVAWTVAAGGSDTEVEDTAALASGGTATPSVTLSTSVETFIAGVLHSGVDNPTFVTPGADYTQTLEHDFGAQTGSWVRRTSNAAAGSPVCDWATNSAEAAVLASAIREAAGGGGTPVELAGDIAGSATQTGQFNTLVPLAGDIAGAAAQVGDLTTAAASFQELAGDIAGAAALTGALDPLTPLAGGVAGASAQTGDLEVVKPLAGGVAGAGSQTGALSGTVALAGGVAGASSQTGHLTGVAITAATNMPAGTFAPGSAVTIYRWPGDAPNVGARGSRQIPIGSGTADAGGGLVLGVAAEPHDPLLAEGVSPYGVQRLILTFAV